MRKDLKIKKTALFFGCSDSSLPRKGIYIFRNREDNHLIKFTTNKRHKIISRWGSLLWFNGRTSFRVKYCTLTNKYDKFPILKYKDEETEKQIYLKDFYIGQPAIKSEKINRGLVNSTLIHANDRTDRLAGFTHYNDRLLKTLVGFNYEMI